MNQKNGSIPGLANHHKRVQNAYGLSNTMGNANARNLLPVVGKALWRATVACFRLVKRCWDKIQRHQLERLHEKWRNQ